MIVSSLQAHQPASDMENRSSGDDISPRGVNPQDARASVSRKALPARTQRPSDSEEMDSESLLSMIATAQRYISQSSSLPPVVRTKPSSTTLFDTPDEDTASPKDRSELPNQKPLPLLPLLPGLTTHTLASPVSSTPPMVSGMRYRASDSSSARSKRSNISSARSRDSSVSSVTDGWSSSEGSAKVYNNEPQLTPKKKGKVKRVSFTDSPAEEITARSNSRYSLKRPKGANLIQDDNISRTPSMANFSPSPRSMSTPLSPQTKRGARLGQAMVGSFSPNAQRSISSGAQAVVPPSTPPRNLSNTSLPRRSLSYTSTSASHTLRDVILSRQDTEQVRLRLMANLESISDLKNCALITKSFYRTFRRHEAHLVGGILSRSSPAAWELRSSVSYLEKPNPFRLKSVSRDLSTLRALLDFILMRCQSICRPRTVEALVDHNPTRRTELEDALWRIWTFCNLFGTTSHANNGISRQLLWLNGGQKKRLDKQNSSFGIGNGEGLSVKQLEDMSEMWRCLEMILSGFRGHEAAARKAGLFEKYTGDPVYSDQEMLDAWIYDILALGPKAVLTLSSCDFDQAKVLGVLRWTPPAKDKRRITFLKAAIEEVYRERLMTEARQAAKAFRHSVTLGHARRYSDSANSPYFPPQGEVLSSRAPMSQMQVDRQLQETRGGEDMAKSPPLNVLEIRPDCDPEANIDIGEIPVMSPSSNPTVFSPLAMTANASTRIGATLFPPISAKQARHRSAPDMIQSSTSTRSETSSPEPEVIDPSDKAMRLLTEQMGFSEPNARRALAMADTGSGLDLQKAIELLSVESKGGLTTIPENPVELPAYNGRTMLSRKSSKREYCGGTCTRKIVMVEPKKERVTGLGIVRRGISARMSFRSSTRLSVIQDDDETSSITTQTVGTKPTTERAEEIQLRQDSHRDTGLNNSARAADKQNLSRTPTMTISKPLPLRPDALLLDKEVGLVQTLSPISPMTPPLNDDRVWPEVDTSAKRDTMSSTTSHERLDEVPTMPPRPRVTLTRVGTTGAKRGWSLRGKRKDKDSDRRGEVIGYVW